MEIAAPHHQMLLGENGANVQRIMLQSGTTICFPNPLMAVSQHQNTVQVTGQMTNVLHARQLLLVSLSLTYHMMLSDISRFMLIIHACFKVSLLWYSVWVLASNAP